MVDINDIFDDINDQISFNESMITIFTKACKSALLKIKELMENNSEVRTWGS